MAVNAFLSAETAYERMMKNVMIKIPIMMMDALKIVD
jgi:hypothetical protein